MVISLTPTPTEVTYISWSVGTYFISCGCFVGSTGPGKNLSGGDGKRCAYHHSIPEELILGLKCEGSHNPSLSALMVSVMARDIKGATSGLRKHKKALFFFSVLFSSPFSLWSSLTPEPLNHEGFSQGGVSGKAM
jgi:hypothetical protein